jgi:hypothetical protein
MSTDHIRGAGATSGVSTNSYIVSDSPPPSHARPSASRRRQRDAGTTEARPLHRLQVRIAWASLKHQYVRMCLNEISKRLFSGRGIAVHRGDKPQVPTPAFETFLRRDMTSFARDALHAILAIGIVPIAFRRPTSSGLGPDELAPYVPVPGTYTITTWAEAGVQRYAFYWNANADRVTMLTAAGTDVFGEEDNNVIIAHDFGFDPNVDGTLSSNMHVIGNELRMAGELSALMLVAERISSNPPLITGYNFQLDAAARAANKEPNFFAGDLDACQNQEDAMYERSMTQQADFAEGLRRWGAQTGLDPRIEFGAQGTAAFASGRDAYTRARPPADGVDHSGAEMPWARTHRLRVTDTHIAHQLPHTRADYTAIMEQVMATVCGVLNVPQGVLSSSTTVRAGVEATAEAMHRTVNHYADMLGALMTGVYRHICGEADLLDELRSRVDRRRRSKYDLAPQLLTERDFFETSQVTHVRLSFDLPPTTSMESLDFLRNRGMLSWQTYGESALRLNGFPADQLDTTTDPFTPTDRRAMILGKDDPRLANGAPPPSAAKQTRKRTRASTQTAKVHKQAATSTAPATKKPRALK